MKYIRLLLFCLFMVPFGAGAVSGDFKVAAQLLSAAKNADIQQVQILINNGADVNYVDATGLSLVCTALMNNDVRAAQILQMYGADASKCDRQIKQYNNRTKPKNTGGLFSGLSSAQSLTLAAAGAAVVIGGLFLLTDVFDPGNDNHKSSTSGNRPGGGGGDTTGGTGKVAFSFPYGPAMPNATSEAQNYDTNLNYWGAGATVETIKNDFLLMTNVYKQNYLLMMHGYSALARGYLGMRTLRNAFSNEPINISGNDLGLDSVMGGRPVNVALVTTNGVNAAPKTSLKDKLMLWTSLNNDGTTTGGASNDMVASKYYNNLIKYGNDKNSLSDDSSAEDSGMLTSFDLAGYGTAINNPFADNRDNLLGKVVGGAVLEDSSVVDFIGFMPNGQMTIFRTGGGLGLKKLDEPVDSGTYTMAGDGLKTGDTMNLFGKELIVARNGNAITATVAETVDLVPGNDLAVGDSFTLSGGQTVKISSIGDDGKTLGAIASQDDGEGGTIKTIYNGYVVENTVYWWPDKNADSYAGYIGADGLLYMDDDASDAVEQAYSMTDGKLMLTKEQVKLDYLNYRALANAAALWVKNDLKDYGRSRPDIIANASVIKPLSLTSAATIDDMMSFYSATDSAAYQAAFINYVNQYYERDDSNGSEGAVAYAFFDGLGSAWSPLVLFSTGAAETDSTYSGAALKATFENAAPLVFNNLDHIFMSVVAVGQAGGNGDATNIAGYTPANKYTLSVWDETAETGNADDTKHYKARVCGIAGKGANGVDPWCFAATGVTDELAVSAAAGAAGIVKSAFYKLTNKELFALLALTADGPYLASATGGGAYTKETLTSHLQSMYVLPNEYQVRYLNGEEYLDLFKEVYGYGLINVERATKPGASVYYYNGDKIVSGNGNAYWRSASRTRFRPSAVLNLRESTIGAPFYDVLESFDGQLTMPRIWDNEITLGEQNRRALYMGDVLAELKTTADVDNKIQFGQFGFSMAVSDRPYYDRLNGLDNLRFDYTAENWMLGAGFQRYFTDGVSRFSGLANPVLGLASNAIVSDVEYKAGSWVVGARAFSGEITDEGLLENDPTVSAQFNPARLGFIQGAQSGLAWRGGAFDFATSVGTALETGTLLGAQTDGLLNLGAGKTTYIDAVMRYRPVDDIMFTLRSTFARTKTDARGEYIMGVSDIDSNAVAFGADIGNLSFSIAQPLAVTRGKMRYAYAQYESVENDAGNFDLLVRDAHIADLNLRPENRELRFMGTYRHKFGAVTDGAVGFIYRVHPNNIDAYGNESILMMKVSHRIGI